MDVIQFNNVERTFTSGNQDFVALKGISLKVGDREFVALVGSSGCGKTTCMRIAAGLEHPTGGNVIGLTNDESDANALMVSKAVADQIVKNPAAMKCQTILLTSNSTGDFAVQSCLKKYGLTKQDVMIKNMGQAEIISALASSGVNLAGLWTPNTYAVEEKAGVPSSARARAAASSCQGP